MTRKDARKLRKIEQLQEKEVDKALEKLKKDINKLIELHKVQAGEKLSMPFNLFEEMYIDIIVRRNVEMGISAVRIERRSLEKWLRRYDVNPKAFEVLDATEKRFVKTIRDIVNRKSVLDGVTVGERIKTLKRGALKTVKNIIDVGIKERKSWVEIAKDIDKYIAPEDQRTRVSPFHFYRKKFGDATSFHIEERAKIPRGTVSYNAHRIARTEISQTWREATITMNGDKPWTKGFEIHRTSTTPCEICDELVDGNPHEDAEELIDPHPNCMCYITTVMMGFEDVEDEVNQWFVKEARKLLEEEYE